jgi:hypothetical protein
MCICSGDVGISRPKSLLCTAAVVVGLLLSGCASSSSSSGGSGGAAPASGGGSTGTFTPASGTTQTGVLFPVYTNKTGGYSFEYPGGWRVDEKGSDVRIARFGNAVTAVIRPRDTAPSYKSYQAQLETMLQQHDDKIISKIDQPASEIKVGKDKVTMAVIEQVRPTGPAADAPKDTLIVNDAWNLMANSFKWN